MILPQNFLCQNIKITSNKLHSRAWKTEVFSSDFWDFRNLCSLYNLTGLNSLYSPIFPIFFPHPDDWIIPGTKMTNTSSFLCKEWIKIQFFNNKFRKLLLKTIFLGRPFPSSNWPTTPPGSGWTSPSTWPTASEPPSWSNTSKSDIRLFLNWFMFSNSFCINVISTR